MLSKGGIVIKWLHTNLVEIWMLLEISLASNFSHCLETWSGNSWRQGENTRSNNQRMRRCRLTREQLCPTSPFWSPSEHLNSSQHQASGHWGCVLVFAGGQDSRQGQGLATHPIIVKDKCLNVASMFLIGWNFCHWSEHERVLFSWEWVTLPYYWLPLLAVGGLVLCKILINLW